MQRKREGFSYKCKFPEEGENIYYTKEQIRRANQVDLKNYLERNREKLIRAGREWRLERDHSITIRGNKWYDHGSDTGGGLAVSGIQHIYGVSFTEAVEMLLKSEGILYYTGEQREEKNRSSSFCLPEANLNNNRVFAYLTKVRCISPEIVNFFFRTKLLYESCEASGTGDWKYHNAIFVGIDKEGRARHAHRKGLNNRGTNFRGNVENSDPRYSFHLYGSVRLYVFEGPIDMLSYISLCAPDSWTKYCYVSLCGVHFQAIEQMIQDCKIEHVILCLDHDSAGIKAGQKIEKELSGKGLKVSRESSVNKDWNEDLKGMFGRAALPAEDISIL